MNLLPYAFCITLIMASRSISAMQALKDKQEWVAQKLQERAQQERQKMGEAKSEADKLAEKIFNKCLDKTEGFWAWKKTLLQTLAEIKKIQEGQGEYAQLPGITKKEVLAKIAHKALDLERPETLAYIMDKEIAQLERIEKENETLTQEDIKKINDEVFETLTNWKKSDYYKEMKTNVQRLNYLSGSTLGAIDFINQDPHLSSAKKRAYEKAYVKTFFNVMPDVTFFDLKGSQAETNIQTLNEITKKYQYE